MSFEPQSSGYGRIHRRTLPPGSLVAAAVGLAMMSPTPWDGELVADLALERPALGKSRVAGVRGLGPTDQAWGRFEDFTRRG